MSCPIRGVRHRSSSALALAAVFAASAAAGFLVFNRLVLLHLPPSWDEGAHAMFGALIAHDIREGDLAGFLFDSFRQVYWTPLHSWLVGAAFLLAGPSLEASRAVSVFCFVLLAPTLFLVARMIAPRHCIVAGCVAAALSLTTPGIISSAAQGMLELPGLMMLSLTMLVYCGLERDRRVRPRAHALLGVGVVLTYLIKANYGILLVISIVLAKLIAVRFRARRLLTKQNLYAVLPLGLFCVVWFAYPPKAVWTWNALVNTPYGGEAGQGLAGLLFFPRALARHSGSWWMMTILWAGLLLAWRTRYLPGVPFIALLALNLFVIGELHHTKIPRHILPMFPPMFVLTGVAAAQLWGWLRSHGKGGAAATAVGLACIALFHTSVLISRDWRYRKDVPVDDVVDYVSAEAQAGAPALVVGLNYARPEPPILDMKLVSAGVLPVTRAGSAMNFFWEQGLMRDIRHERLPERPRAIIQRLLDRYYAPTTMRSLHAYDRGPLARSRFKNYLATTLDRDPPRVIIAVSGSSTNYGIEEIAPDIAKGGFREVSVREFPRAQTRVHVYRRP